MLNEYFASLSWGDSLVISHTDHSSSLSDSESLSSTFLISTWVIPKYFSGREAVHISSLTFFFSGAAFSPVFAFSFFSATFFLAPSSLALKSLTTLASPLACSSASASLALAASAFFSFGVLMASASFYFLTSALTSAWAAASFLDSSTFLPSSALSSSWT